MIEQVMITILIIALGFGAFRLYRSYDMRRATTRIKDRDPLLTETEDGRPTILYFTADYCAPCRLRQRPAIKKLTEEWNANVQIIEVDIVEQTEDAKRWGIMSIPTTYILNSQGEVTAINYGVASAQKLKQQLEG